MGRGSRKGILGTGIDVGLPRSLGSDRFLCARRSFGRYRVCVQDRCTSGSDRLPQRQHVHPPRLAGICFHVCSLIRLIRLQEDLESVEEHTAHGDRIRTNTFVASCPVSLQTELMAEPCSSLARMMTSPVPKLARSESRTAASCFKRKREITSCVPKCPEFLERGN